MKGRTGKRNAGFAHRGYYVQTDLMGSTFYISKDGHNIGSAKSAIEAKRIIDDLVRNPGAKRMVQKAKPKRRNCSTPSPAQLRQRENFARMSKKRALVRKREANASRKAKSNRGPVRSVKGRRNTADDLFAEFRSFQGREPQGISAVMVPQSGPARSYLLGRLVRLVTREETLSMAESEGINLVADKANKLWIVGKEYPAFEPHLDLGELFQVRYVTFKRHLDRTTKEYFHDFGEDGGRLPRLVTDAEGRLLIKGGDYVVEWRGIVG